MKSYFRVKIGVLGSPLAYVLRHEVEVDDNARDAAYPTNEDRLIRITPHTNNHYPTDNQLVYDEIKRKLGAVATSYILPFDAERNVRGAWLRLCSHFDGEAAMNKRKETCESQLRTDYWDGKSKRYTLEKHIAKQERNFFKLALPEINAPVAESEKVNYLLKSIRDPRLKSPRISFGETPLKGMIIKPQSRTSQVALPMMRRQLTRHEIYHPSIAAVAAQVEGAVAMHKDVVVDADAMVVDAGSRKRPTH